MLSSTTDRYRRNPRPASLLIVEDNPDERVIIGKAISQTLDNVQPVWASSETEALHYLEECVRQQQPLPRIVLLDLYLPKREQGWQFLQTIRDRAWRCRMLVVVLSRSSEPSDISTAYDLGASSYTTKPADLDGWFDYFAVLRTYWWQTVTLPNI